MPLSLPHTYRDILLYSITPQVISSQQKVAVNCKSVRNKCELEILTLKSTAVLFNSSYVLLLSM